jgi:hypothetical protein
MSENKFIDVYNTMITYLHEDIGDASKTLARAMDAAREKASELGGITQDEINRIADFVKRDIEQAAHSLPDENESLSEWLKFDIAMIENFALDAFKSLADKTRLELTKLDLEASHLVTYKTGEITGPGSLRCESCNETITFTTTHEIPACHHCQGKTFIRG